MNRPAFTILALAGLLIAFQLPVRGVRALPAALQGPALSTPGPTPTPTPDSSQTAPPSPTVVVPLVDLSVSNSAAPSASPTASPSAAPVPVETPSPSPSPSRNRRRNVKPEPTETPAPTAEPTLAPEALPTASPEPTAAPRRTPVRPAERPLETNPPDQGDGFQTPIPTQPPTPRPIAPVQPSIPDSLDDPNVQSILSRPIPQLSQFGWMTGTWGAHVFEDHGEGSQRDLGKNTYVFATTMKGRWIFGGDGHGSDYFYITYDPFSRHWALTRMNGNPAYGIWISYAGWHQNRIQFDSTYSWVNGRQYHRRLTLIHTDARQFSLFDEEQLPSGAWLADQTIQFTKQQ